MKLSKRIYRPAYRKRKAYWTAFVVTFSYLKISFLSYFFGEQYYQQRLLELHQKNAEKVKNAILELQGLFVKIGQTISILSNMLPDEFREPLESLQDRNAARDYAEVAATIEQELGKKQEEIFTTFDKIPLAAASIGQVHRAQIGGKEVVVKIQHANIDIIAAADLEILKNLVKIHGWFMNMKGLEHLYDQVRLMIEAELDYAKEAASMQRIRENIAEEKDLRVIIPEVFPDYSTSKVLVSAYCEGVKIANTKQLDAWQVPREDLVDRLVTLYCKMVLVDGYYQADPHPGNILVNEFGDIILLDYGAVSEVSSNMKTAIPELVEAIVRDDTDSTVDALRKMGFIARGTEATEIAEHLIEVFKNFLQEEVQLDGLDFKSVELKSGLGSIAGIIKEVDLRDVSSTIQIPKDYVLLYRTLMLLVGISFEVAPKLNLLDVVQPYFKEHVLSNANDVKSLIFNSLKSQVTTAIALPGELQKYLKTANRGQLQYEAKGQKAAYQMQYWLGQQFLFALLFLGSCYFVFMMNKSDFPTRYSFFYGLSVLSFLLLVRAWWKGARVRK